MNIDVTKNEIIITNKTKINTGEYHVNKCYYNFETEYETLIKKAIFKCGDIIKEVPIINNESIIPYEVLDFNVDDKDVEVRVYGYEIDNDKLIKRYSPNYDVFTKNRGSYISDVSSSEEITPTQFEQYNSKLEEGLEKLDEAIESIDVDTSYAREMGDFAKEQATFAKEQGDYAKEQGDSINNTITEIKNSIPKNTSDLNNDSGFVNKLSDDLLNYYTKDNTFTKEEINNLVSSIPKFKIEVVEELPTEDISSSSIYLVPSSTNENDVYKEYIYANENWELLGVQKVDLSDYYKKNEIDELLFFKVDKKTLENYYTTEQINKLLENKVSISVLDDYINNDKLNKTLENYYAKEETYSKEEIDTIIGSIDAILDSINGEVI